MFTGLVESVGEIKKTVRRGAGLEMVINGAFAGDGLTLGESIAIDGACLTVTARQECCFSVDVSPETLNRTTFNEKKVGDRVNLERALRLSDRLGGHLVTGHIDGIGIIRGIERKGDFMCLRIQAPVGILAYVIEKGSIAVDGISLTVNSCTQNEFDVMIIPHTFAKTTLQYKKVGEKVNLENDLIAKYVEKFLLSRRTSGITKEFLQQFGIS
ncbi:MAG: riboflavin synthase [Desulfobacterota bacterium]|nr:riboflavin synthase [Thermodesulfobacteriota bacterium]